MELKGAYHSAGVGFLARMITSMLLERNQSRKLFVAQITIKGLLAGMSAYVNAAGMEANWISIWLGHDTVAMGYLLECGETVEAILAHMTHVLRLLDHLGAQMLFEMSAQIVEAIEDTIAHLAAHGVVLIGRAGRVFLMALQVIRARKVLATDFAGKRLAAQLMLLLVQLKQRAAPQLGIANGARIIIELRVCYENVTLIARLRLKRLRAIGAVDVAQLKRRF